MKPLDTKTRLLDEAQRLVQERGFNAFSYRDLADAVGVRTASIHYHFRSKSDLGLALVTRYLESLEKGLAAIDAAGGDCSARLRKLTEVFRGFESDGVLCLCGSLASDLSTLDPPVSLAVQRYFRTSKQWLFETIQAGVETGEFRQDASAEDAATSYLAGLQGALLLARADPEEPAIDQVEQTLLAFLTG